MKRNNQSGHIQLIIIIVLVIALLGAVSYIVVKKINGTDSTSSSNSAAASRDTDSTTAAGTLLLSDWGVKGSYSQGLSLVATKDTSYGLDSYKITRPDLTTDGCSDIGHVYRYAPSAQIEQPDGTSVTAEYAYQNKYYHARAHIGNYYYLYAGPQAACSDNSTIADGQGQAYDATTEAISGLKAE